MTALSEPSCPNCGSEKTASTLEQESFNYGSGVEHASLTVVVPVIQCSSCGFSFTDHRAEDAKHEVVCRHLQVLSPREIRAIRTSYDLGQSEFADLAGIGRASLARWEGGQLIQNHSSNNLLFLLSFPENLNKLRKRAQALKAQTSAAPSWANKSKFRQLKNEDVKILKIEADCFDPFCAFEEGATCM